MKSLVLDTSNRYLVVAMYEDDQLLKAIQEEGSQRQSENAIPYIEKMLSELSLELFDFDEMVVTCGPGSYTGERVGLTIVKTLKTVHDVSVKMVSSLAAYAGVNGKKISIIDARSKKIFVSVYDNGQPVIDEKMIAIEDFEVLRENYADYEVVGQTELVHLETKPVCLYENIHALSKQIEACQNVHELLPRYIKDVEAKKIWQP